MCLAETGYFMRWVGENSWLWLRQNNSVYGAGAFSEKGKLGAGRLVENRVEAEGDGVINAQGTVLGQVGNSCLASNLGDAERSGVAEHTAVVLLGFLHGSFGLKKFVAAVGR